MSHIFGQSINVPIEAVPACTQGEGQYVASAYFARNPVRHKTELLVTRQDLMVPTGSLAHDPPALVEYINYEHNTRLFPDERSGVVAVSLARLCINRIHRDGSKDGFRGEIDSSIVVAAADSIRFKTEGKPPLPGFASPEELVATSGLTRDMRNHPLILPAPANAGKIREVIRSEAANSFSFFIALRGIEHFVASSSDLVAQTPHIRAVAS